ncbi:MAG: hypothetical protein HYT39_02450 [Candidatus Sungbacteria bacterium]|nr:hypothetical protein [Candidatus Sungbacteria bacterium]
MIKITNSKHRFKKFEFRILNLFRISDLGFRVSAYGGFGLIEVIITSALISLVLGAFIQVANVSLKLLQNEKYTLEASYLLEEGIEGLRVIRDSGWDANIAPLANGTSYYLLAASTYSLTAVPPPFINGRYMRTIVWGAVNRDANDRIASAGTLDPGTRQATVTVAWSNRQATTSVQSVIYLTNFRQD